MSSLPHLQDRIVRHREELLGFLRRRAPGEAEELSQEVWLRVARADASFTDDRAFRAYTYTVARRLLVDHWRRRSARVSLVPLDGGAAPAAAGQPDDHVAAAEVLAVVEAELARMPAPMAQVFRWRTARGVPFKDIARRQGVSVNTALGRMHRAVRRLAAALDAAGLAPDSLRGLR